MAEETIPVFFPGGDWYAIVRVGDIPEEQVIESNPVLFWRIDYEEKEGGIVKVSAIVWAGPDKKMQFNYDYQEHPGFLNFVKGKPARTVGVERAKEILSRDFGLTEKQVTAGEKDRRGQKLLDILARQNLDNDVEGFDQDR